jgi:hypothetical protein
VYSRDNRPDGIRDDQYVRVSERATLANVLDAFEQGDHWSGRLVETVRFVFALDEYVRAALLEGSFGPSDETDGAESVSLMSRATASRGALRLRIVSLYRSVEERLPKNYEQLVALEERLIEVFTVSARVFALGVGAIARALLPPWAP